MKKQLPWFHTTLHYSRNTYCAFNDVHRVAKNTLTNQMYIYIWKACKNKLLIYANRLSLHSTIPSHKCVVQCYDCQQRVHYACSETLLMAPLCYNLKKIKNNISNASVQFYAIQSSSFSLSRITTMLLHISKHLFNPLSIISLWTAFDYKAITHLAFIFLTDRN